MWQPWSADEAMQMPWESPWWAEEGRESFNHRWLWKGQRRKYKLAQRREWLRASGDMKRLHRDDYSSGGPWDMNRVEVWGEKGKLKDPAPPPTNGKSFTKMSSPEAYHGLTTHHSNVRLGQNKFWFKFPSRTAEAEFSPIFSYSQNGSRAHAINSYNFSYYHP